MKRRRMTLSLPAIKKYREAIANGKFAAYLIESGEKVNAGSVKVKYTYKNIPWVFIIEAKRIYGKRFTR